MLHALKNHLIQLSVEQDRNFAGALRKRVGARQAKLDAAPLRNFILVLPEMIAQVRAWSEDETLPRPLRNLQGHLLTYLYHPVDFIHDGNHGLFGYLDDAYFVACIYQLSLNSGRGGLKHLPNQKDISHQIAGWTETVRRILPKETARIHRMITELSGGKMDTLERMLGKSDRFAIARTDAMAAAKKGES